MTSARSILFFLILSSLLDSCSNNSNQTEQSNAPEKSSPLNCYQFASSGDTIILKVIHIGNSVTGTLAYQLPGKNTSKGTILGHMKEDLLVVKFTPFVDSTTPRQVVFKLIDKYLLEGYGESYVNNGQIIFKDLQQLQFNDSIKLKEYACK